jgi:hypothetical protein
MVLTAASDRMRDADRRFFRTRPRQFDPAGGSKWRKVPVQHDPCGQDQAAWPISFGKANKECVRCLFPVGML